MNYLRRHRAQLLASLVLTAAISAIAQPPASDAPTLKVNTRLTQVDVTATDLKGHPVQALKQSDFTVKEDGKPQPIKNFEESSAQKLSSAPTPQLAPHTYTNAHPQLPNTSAVNVLLVDNVTTGTHAENVMYSRNEAIKFAQTLPAGTEVIILELADKLRVVQNLTTDRDVLLAALRSITPRPYLGDLNAQSQMVVDALDNAAAFLSAIKGRKNLIWFTPGIPWITDYDGYQAVYDVLTLRDYSASLERDYNLLAAAQIAVYPVDPKGVVVNGARAPDPLWHVSMEDLADATGGQAFYNSNDLASYIGQAINAGTHFYSISYVPPSARYDGQYHKINVTVNRPGVHLVYRRGYTSIDPAKPPKPTTRTEQATTTPAPDAALYTAMAHGAAPSTQIVFTVAITLSNSPFGLYNPVLGQLNPKVKSGNLTRYNFNFTLDPKELTLTEANGNQHQGSMEFTVAAYNGQGEILNVIRETASLTLLPSQLTSFYQRSIPMQLQLDLPPGPLFLRAAVRDLPTNKLGTLEIPLTVPR